MANGSIEVSKTTVSQLETYYEKDGKRVNQKGLPRRAYCGSGDLTGKGAGLIWLMVLDCGATILTAVCETKSGTQLALSETSIQGKVFVNGEWINE